MTPWVMPFTRRRRRRRRWGGGKNSSYIHQQCDVLFGWNVISYRAIISKKMRPHRSFNAEITILLDFILPDFILLHLCLGVVSMFNVDCRFFKVLAPLVEFAAHTTNTFQEMYANIFTKSRYCSCLLAECVRVYVFTIGLSVFRERFLLHSMLLLLLMLPLLLFFFFSPPRIWYVCVEARACAQANNNNNCNNRRWCVFCICLAWHNRVRVTIVCFRFRDFLRTFAWFSCLVGFVVAFTIAVFFFLLVATVVYTRSQE